MGCWNGTCFISDLPILEGETVMVIPVIQEKGGVLQTVLAPFQGIADDAGSIKSAVSSETADRILAHVEENRVCSLDPLAQARSKELFSVREECSKLSRKTREPAELAAVEARSVRACEEQRELINEHCGKFILPKDKRVGLMCLEGAHMITATRWEDALESAPVLFLLVHMAVWDKLVTATMTTKQFVVCTKEKERGWYYADGAEYIKCAILGPIEKMTEDNKAIEAILASKVDAKHLNQHQKLNHQTVLGMFLRGEDQLRYDLSYTAMSLFVKGDNYEEIASTTSTQMLTDLWCLSTILAHTRKCLRVPEGLGSQMQDYRTMSALADAMHDVCKLHEKETYV